MIIHNGRALDEQNDGNPWPHNNKVCGYVIFTKVVNDDAPGCATDKVKWGTSAQVPSSPSIPTVPSSFCWFKMFSFIVESMRAWAKNLFQTNKKGHISQEIFQSKKIKEKPQNIWGWKKSFIRLKQNKRIRQLDTSFCFSLCKLKISFYGKWLVYILTSVWMLRTPTASKIVDS